MERKNRRKAEVDQVILWLTGYTSSQLKTQVELDVDLETFFSQAPKLNPSIKLITGLICGIRVENITAPLMQEIRYLDKLIDELAQGKKIEAILSQS